MTFVMISHTLLRGTESNAPAGVTQLRKGTKPVRLNAESADSYRISSFLSLSAASSDETGV